jgi:hypothetical protein
MMGGMAMGMHVCMAQRGILDEKKPQTVSSLGLRDA